MRDLSPEETIKAHYRRSAELATSLPRFPTLGCALRGKHGFGRSRTSTFTTNCSFPSKGALICSGSVLKTSLFTHRVCPSRSFRAYERSSFTSRIDPIVQRGYAGDSSRVRALPSDNGPPHLVFEHPNPVFHTSARWRSGGPNAGVLVQAFHRGLCWQLLVAEEATRGAQYDLVMRLRPQMAGSAHLSSRRLEALCSAMPTH